MEKLNFVKNGVLRLPPGFRFHPTDEELVVQYLKRKVHSCPLPASIIPEVDVCKADPWDLPGDSEQERYFFSTREVKYPNGNRSNRATGSGYWKATGLDKQILTSRNNSTTQAVGMKKTLVFYRGKPPHGSRTDWIMHEYRLVSPQTTPTTKGMENWVLCRIFLKRRSNNNSKNEEEKRESMHLVSTQNGERASSDDATNNNSSGKTKPVFYDFLGKEKTDLTSSSGSSGITDVSTSDHEEESSTNCNDLSTFRRK